jgi:hypothetical protein
LVLCHLLLLLLMQMHLHLLLLLQLLGLETLYIMKW